MKRGASAQKSELISRIAVLRPDIKAYSCYSLGRKRGP